MSGGGSDRVIAILQTLGATEYVSGPSGQEYLDADAFAAAGITLRWKDYAGYPEYAQMYPPFEHHVTVLDLLFHTGGDASHYIWGWRALTSAGENACGSTT